MNKIKALLKDIKLKRKLKKLNRKLKKLRKKSNDAETIKEIIKEIIKGTIIILHKAGIPYIFVALEIAEIQNNAIYDRKFSTMCEEICNVSPKKYLREGLYWYELYKNNKSIEDFLKNILSNIINSIIAIMIGFSALGNNNMLKVFVLTVAIIYNFLYVCIMINVILSGRKNRKYAYYASIIQKCCEEN